MRLVMTIIMATCYAISFPSLAHTQPSCSDWNTQAFFKIAKTEDVQRCLASGKTLQARDEEGWTPLHFATSWAASHSTSPMLIKTLLDAGASVHARDVFGNTPLHQVASHTKSSAMITALLNTGAHVNAQNHDGWTPLHKAALNNKSPQVIDALLDAGADPKAQDKKGHTPSNYAYYNKNLEGTDAYQRLNQAQLH